MCVSVSVSVSMCVWGERPFSTVHFKWRELTLLSKLLTYRPLRYCQNPLGAGRGLRSPDPAGSTGKVGDVPQTPVYIGSEGVSSLDPSSTPSAPLSTLSRSLINNANAGNTTVNLMIHQLVVLIIRMIMCLLRLYPPIACFWHFASMSSASDRA